MNEGTSLVPQDGRQELRIRDEKGLLPVQQQYFEMLSKYGRNDTACNTLNIKPARVTRWLREDPAFLRAHEAFYQSSHDATAARFNEMQERLPDLAMELMEANKTIKVSHECTHCGEKDDVSIDTTNDTVRARMWADLMKAAGHLKDIRRLEGEVSVTNYTAGQRLAIEKLKRGLPVSVQQRKELEEMGALEGLKLYDGVEIIEGEVRDLTTED